MKATHRRAQETSLAALSKVADFGIETAWFLVGSPDDPTSPQVAYVRFPPGLRVDAHTHHCDYAEIVLEGSQRIGRTWHHAGDIRIVGAETVYGPLTAGPQGCTVLIVFRVAEQAAMVPPKPDRPVELSLASPVPSG